MRRFRMWDGRQAVEFEPGEMQEGIMQSRREAAERNAMNVQETRAAQKIERIFEETGEYPEDVEVTREELDEFRNAIKERSTNMGYSLDTRFLRGDTYYTDVPIVLRPEDMTTCELSRRIDKLRQQGRHPRADAIQFDDGGRCKICGQLQGGNRSHHCWDKSYVPVNMGPNACETDRRALRSIAAHNANPPVGDSLRPELQKALWDAAHDIADAVHPILEITGRLGGNWDYHGHMLHNHSAAEEAIFQFICSLHSKLCELLIPPPAPPVPPRSLLS